MHRSVATIASPEFVNLTPTDISPMISKCDIKVFYINENRNGSQITKEVGMSMAKTLRGNPIVGYYKKDKGDFADHGEQLIIDDEGLHFNCLTVPYGFVAPDAKVWFQKFDDTDEKGQVVTHEQLMTEGYLWTGQFPECAPAVQDGRPQSMELSNVEGQWSNEIDPDLEFFIINDAVISKLCILGTDVEPCFEGASVTAPKTYNVATNDFITIYASMMREFSLARAKKQINPD